MRRREFLASAGAAGGAVAASTAGSAAAQEAKTHTVEMTDGLKYQPQELVIAPGDTVVFENVGTVPHSVTAYQDGIPEDASYWASGGFETESAARGAWPDGGNVDGGESYEYTFETTGEHEYLCIPHEGAGMVGTIIVQEGGASAGGEGGGGEVDPEEMGVPIQAHFVGIATILMIIVAIVFNFYLLKYGESPNASSPNRK
jgi:plastocyanin